MLNKLAIAEDYGYGLEDDGFKGQVTVSYFLEHCDEATEEWHCKNKQEALNVIVAHAKVYNPALYAVIK